MPGLSASHALIFNEDLRKRFRIYMDAGELDMDMSLLFFLLRLLIVMVRNGLTNVWRIYKEI